MIKAVHHVQITIPVGEESAARDFYCRTLGLEEVQKPASLTGRGGFWLQVGHFQVHVGVEDLPSQRSKAHVAYLVDDIEEWRRRLESHQVTISDGIPIPGYSRFEFRDPFGNRVEFLEYAN